MQCCSLKPQLPGVRRCHVDVAPTAHAITVWQTQRLAVTLLLKET